MSANYGPGTYECGHTRWTTASRCEICFPPVPRVFRSVFEQSRMSDGFAKLEWQKLKLPSGALQVHDEIMVDSIEAMQYSNTGYVDTFKGRKCHLPDVEETKAGLDLAGVTTGRMSVKEPNRSLPPRQLPYKNDLNTRHPAMQQMPRTIPEDKKKLTAKLVEELHAELDRVTLVVFERAQRESGFISPRMMTYNFPRTSKIWSDALRKKIEDSIRAEDERQRIANSAHWDPYGDWDD